MSAKEPLKTAVGELVSMFYEEYLTIYGDKELAAVATAATVNSMLSRRRKGSRMATAEEAEAA